MYRSKRIINTFIFMHSPSVVTRFRDQVDNSLNFKPILGLLQVLPRILSGRKKFSRKTSFISNPLLRSRCTAHTLGRSYLNKN